MISSDKAGVQFPDSESNLLLLGKTSYRFVRLANRGIVFCSQQADHVSVAVCRLQRPIHRRL
jgi:hypothetical protein